jgi:hypothetical protein
MAEVASSAASLTGFEKYPTATLLRIAGKMEAGLQDVHKASERGVVNQRPKAGAATPREAGYTVIMLRDGINAVLAGRGVHVEDDRNPHSVQREQIWQDNDKRVQSWRGGPRLLKVLAIDLTIGKAKVEPVNQDGSQTGERETWIKLTRFAPTSTGYLRRADLDR